MMYDFKKLRDKDKIIVTDKILEELWLKDKEAYYTYTDSYDAEYEAENIYLNEGLNALIDYLRIIE